MPHGLSIVEAVIEKAKLPVDHYGKFMVGHNISYSLGETMIERVLYMRQGTPLGKGQYGDVFLEQAQNECSVAPKFRAVKEINKDFSAKHNIEWQREVEALVVLSQSESNASFVAFYGWYETVGTVYLAMEYFDLGDLAVYLDNILEEDEVKTISRQLVAGLKVMHDHSIVHRDMKPKNIFVSALSPEWRVKIADFGVSKRPSEVSGLWTTQGTMGYMAPEYSSFMRQDSGAPSPTPAVDIWSLGCIIYELFTKECPFREENKAFRKFCEDMILPQALYNSFAGNEAQQLVREMLDPRPEHRITAEDALQMIWFADDTSQDTPKLGAIAENFGSLNLDRREFDAMESMDILSSPLHFNSSSYSLATSVTLADETDSVNPSQTINPSRISSNGSSCSDTDWSDLVPSTRPGKASSLTPRPLLPSRQQSHGAPLLPRRPTESASPQPPATMSVADAADTRSLIDFDEVSDQSAMAPVQVPDSDRQAILVGNPPAPPALPPRPPAQGKNPSIVVTRSDTPDSWFVISIMEQVLCFNFGPIHCVRQPPTSCDLCEAMRCIGKKRPQTLQNLLHLCETCGGRYMCEFCARNAIIMPGDSHEADHFLRRLLPVYSFPFARFLASSALTSSCQEGVPQTYGLSWLQSDHSFSPPIQLRSGKVQSRFLLDAPPGQHKITCSLRISFDPQKCSSEVIGGARKALIKIQKDSYGTITVGAQAVAAGSDYSNTSPQRYLPPGFVERALRRNPEQNESNIIIALDTSIKILPGQSLEVQIRSAYDYRIFKAGSPFKFYVDDISISQFGEKVQLASAGEINKRTQFLAMQKKHDRDRKIDQYMKWGTNGLQVASMGTGLARTAQGLAAASAKKRSYRMAEAAHLGGLIGSLTPHGHGAASVSDPSLAYHGQQMPVSAGSYYGDAWEADSQVDLDQHSVTGSTTPHERPLLRHHASDSVPIQTTFEQFEYTVADADGHPGEGAAALTYSRWDAVG